MGDFTGFTFSGVHSTELGITRVADGDRYKDTLQPEIKDLSAEVSGKNGEYFFGFTHGNRHFNLNIAYDYMKEGQMRKLTRLFGNQQVGSLIFDEAPYKKYLVKLEDPIELSYVCFDEQRKVPYSDYYDIVNDNDLPDGPMGKIDPWVTLDGTEQIYKGEGTIDLIGYYPFAKSCFKILPTAAEYGNVSEWAGASRILDSETYNNYKFDVTVSDEDNYKINIYNAGDIKTGCRIYCPFVVENQSYNYNNLRFTYINGLTNESKELCLKDVVKSAMHDTDIGFLINTDSGVIQGVQSFTYDENNNPIITTSSSLYNRYVVAGEFFKLQPNLTYTDGSSIIISGGNEAIQVFYDYLYF